MEIKNGNVELAEYMDERKRMWRKKLMYTFINILPESSVKVN